MFGLDRVAMRVLGGVALLGVLWMAVDTVLGWKEERDTLRLQITALEQTAQAAVEMSGAAGAAITQARKQQGAVERVRQQTRNNYEQATITDMAVRDWAVQPIPSRLRELASEQRIERERLAGIAAGDASADATTPPAR